MTGHAWGYWHRPQGGHFVWDEHGTGAVIGEVLPHVVTAEQRASWGAARSRGEWIAQGSFPTAGCVERFHRTRHAAAEALWRAWLADPDTNAPEVPAP